MLITVVQQQNPTTADLSKKQLRTLEFDLRASELLSNAMCVPDGKKTIRLPGSGRTMQGGMNPLHRIPQKPLGSFARLMFHSLQNMRMSFAISVVTIYTWPLKNWRQKMENQIYERDYRQAKERKRQVLQSTDFDVIGELKAAGFFQKLNERLNQIPKVIVPEDKVNYDYLLEQCDAFAKRHGGRLRGIVDFEQYESHINLYVPFFEIDFPEDRRFIFDVLTRSTYFSFMPDKTGWTRLHIFINYFSEAISQDAKADIINQLCEEMGDEFQNNLVQNNRFGTAVDKLYDIGIYDEAPEYEGSTQTMDGMTIMAKKIRAYRESLGKSQYELASDWSLPTNELVALESGKADPFLSTIVKVAGFMGLSASELLNERR